MCVVCNIYLPRCDLDDGAVNTLELRRGAPLVTSSAGILRTEILGNAKSPSLLEVGQGNFHTKHHSSYH